MTAIAPVDRAGQNLVGSPARWRRLVWNTWRQHRAALSCLFGLAALAAAGMAVTRERHPGLSLDGDNAVTVYLLVALLLFLPVLAGIFVGAPLLARESEQGTTALIWVQGVSRQRWLIAQVVPWAGLALAATGLGLEYRWWSPLPGAQDWVWRFSLNPLPLAGWTVLGLALGVLCGGVIRRTVPAMVATLAGCAGLYYLATRYLRPHYLPPVTGRVSPARFVLDRLLLQSWLAWPDGRPLSSAEVHQDRAWQVAHHIAVWAAYQPASRFGLFELIEFGWLIVLSAVLTGIAMIMISRRPA